MKKVSKYGIKIKNFQAGSLYQCNIGVRKNYDYTKAMFANNLLMYYLLDNGLKVDSVVLAEQIRTIDKSRLKEKIGHLDDEKVMAKINNALGVSFGL